MKLVNKNTIAGGIVGCAEATLREKYGVTIEEEGE